MAKGMLFNNYWAYIASGSGDQAITTFKTLENIANRNIESMTGLTGVFKQEMEVRNASGDGFVHNPSGHFYSLYNGSFTKTLNSNIDKKRGKEHESASASRNGRFLNWGKIGKAEMPIRAEVLWQHSRHAQSIGFETVSEYNNPTSPHPKQVMLKVKRYADLVGNTTTRTIG